MASKRLYLLLIVPMLLTACYGFLGVAGQAGGNNSTPLSYTLEEYARTKAAHERERPCPALQLSGMEVETLITPKSTQKKFKPAYVGVTSEIVTASKLSWNKKCWAVSGIPTELLKAAIQNALQSSQMLADDISDGQFGYILETTVLEQWEKSYTNAVDDFSKEGHLTLKYIVINPDTNAIVWEKKITTIAKVSYGAQAKGDKLLPEQITSNEYRRIMFESAVKQNLTLLVEDLSRF